MVETIKTKKHLEPNNTMEVQSVLNKRHSPAPFPIHSSSSCLLLLCDGVGKKIPMPLPSLLLCYHCPQQISSHPSLSLILILFEQRQNYFHLMFCITVHLNENIVTPSISDSQLSRSVTVQYQ